MWRKNRKNDLLYHYCKDQMSNAFSCGIPIGDCVITPDISEDCYCLQCLWHLKNLEPVLDVPTPTILNSPNLTTATQAMKEIQSPPVLQSTQVVEPFLLGSIHYYTGNKVPASMLSYDFEHSFLHKVLKLTASRMDELHIKLKNARSGSYLGSYGTVNNAVQAHVTQDAQRQLEILHGMQEQPYFGRIDFTTENDFGEAIYIGRGTLEEKKYLVYDWRAPVCTMFYQHTPGPAYYNAPIGVVKGYMILKRHWLCQGLSVK